MLITTVDIALLSSIITVKYCITMVETGEEKVKGKKKWGPRRVRRVSNLLLTVASGSVVIFEFVVVVVAASVEHVVVVAVL